MLRNVPIYFVFLISVFSLNSCSDHIPEGELSEEDMYGDWVLTTDMVNSTLLIRKDVSRVRMQWKDGSKYEGRWGKWELEDPEDGISYRIYFSDWKNDLYSNYHEGVPAERTTAPSKAELSHLLEVGLNTGVYKYGGQLHIAMEPDDGLFYKQVTSSDGTIRPEDEPPEAGGGQGAERSEGQEVTEDGSVEDRDVPNPRPSE